MTQMQERPPDIYCHCPGNGTRGVNIEHIPNHVHILSLHSFSLMGCERVESWHLRKVLGFFVGDGCPTYTLPGWLSSISPAKHSVAAAIRYNLTPKPRLQLSCHEVRISVHCAALC